MVFPMVNTLHSSQGRRSSPPIVYDTIYPAGEVQPKRTRFLSPLARESYDGSDYTDDDDEDDDSKLKLRFKWVMSLPGKAGRLLIPSRR